MKRKAPATSTSKSSQTIPSEPTTSRKVTAEDLTSDTPVNDSFWETLAEQRRVALQETLTENQDLYERIANLEDELNQSKSMLEEARDLVTVLTEMLEEKEESGGPNASVETEPPTDTSDNNLDVTL
jgi:geminin